MTTLIGFFQQLIKEEVYNSLEIQQSFAAILVLSGNDYPSYFFRNASAQARVHRFSQRSSIFGRPLSKTLSLQKSHTDAQGAVQGHSGFSFLFLHLPSGESDGLNLKRIEGLGQKKVAVTTLQPSGCLPSITVASSFQKCNGTLNSLANYHNLLLKQSVAKLNN
ncbi:hypothetical protein Ddye_008226 [Dipteronia dyeriana]|uniref:Uncharacterized protein n=1 Tax=Dipteronia dyeriana TaxID=168575 RepID=A0AAD9X959_9ROSI|nr:hypothetical protein Ddye_008226 [Dipteronia dyeriana]